MKNSNTYSLKTKGKKIALALGIYKPARYLNDLFYRRTYRASFKRDIEFHRSFLPLNSLCFDVGANMGKKTDALLRSGMRVLALEPQPTCAAEIRARCTNNPNLTIIETAVGSQTGETELFVSDTYHASSSLMKECSESSTSIVVPVTTLLVSKQITSPSPRLIK